MLHHYYAPRLSQIMRKHDLGALIASDGLIGAAYENALDVLCDHEANDITPSEAQRLDEALDVLDDCYDPETGYCYKGAPAEHKAIWDVVAELERIIDRRKP